MTEYSKQNPESRMRRCIPILFALLLISEFCLPTSAASLPSFEDFRRADRERRLTGQRQTAESMALMRVNPKLIARVGIENPNDPDLLLGAAELGGDWSAVLVAGGTNAVVALRFACASAVKRDYETALRWFRHCQTNDTGNAVPWLGELWVLRQQDKMPEAFRAPDGAMDYRDYVVPAARARIRALEKAGYFPYAARRIGLMQSTFVESMAQDLSRDMKAPRAAPFLLSVARAMQRRSTFLLTELVGQTLEHATLAAQPKADEKEIETRLEEIDTRRDELKQLVAVTERRTADFATGSEMVKYFDDVLAIGEEAAMKRLAETVRVKPGKD